MNKILNRFLMTSSVTASLLAMSSANAAEAKRVFMVEIAVFTCPASRETNTMIEAVEREVGKEFVFAPISEGQVSPAVRAWFALRDDGQAGRVRSMLFKLMQDVRMESPSDRDVAEWIGITAETTTQAKVVETKMRSMAVGRAVNRAVRLTQKAGVRKVPAFVYVSGDEVLGVVERGEMSAEQFVARGLERYRQLTQSGTQS